MKICTIYLVIGLTWILFSDKAVFMMAIPDDLKLWLSTFKGFLYVIVTALILYGLIRHYIREIEDRQVLYQNVVENAGSIILKTDISGIVLVYNEYAEHFFKKPAAQVLGRSLGDLLGIDGRIPDKWQDIFSPGSLVPEEFSQTLEMECTIGGTEGIWILWTIKKVKGTDEIPSLLMIGTDISLQKSSAQSLFKINRAIKTISECNQALIHETEEGKLLQAVCRIIVETGGHRMAWIGYPQEDEEKSVLPVASAGYVDGYLDAVQISWGDNAPGHGHTGSAVRTGSLQILRTGTETSESDPWHEELQKRGYASSIALPLKENAHTFGVLSIYATSPDAFDEHETYLLLQLAEDLAYGIHTIRTREKLEIAREKLLQSEERLRLTLDATNDGLWDWNVQSGNAFASPRYTTMLEYAPGDLTESYDTWLTLVHPDDIAAVIPRLDLSLQKGTDFSAEFRMKTKTGGWRWILSRGKVVAWDSDKKPLRMVGTNSDITDRKEAEQELLRVSRELRDAIFQIDQNMGTLAVLNDKIRNPLTIIEILSEDLEDAKRKKIHSQVEAIDNIINELDKGWIESDKIRMYLKKHHGLFD